MRAAVAAAAVALALAGCAPGDDQTDEPLVVAAAADLMPAFSELGERFEEATGHAVTFTFASSGRLAQQTIEGAPIDLFASADAAAVDRVIAAGRGEAATRTTYAVGRLAIWSRAEDWGGWGDLADVVADERVRVLAIANPEHAPYGVAAREALERAGLWAAAAERVVYGDNIADTQRLAATGNAEVAVVALSLALAADERGEGRWVLVAADTHTPLRQDLVVTADDSDRAALAASFAAFVDGEEGREVLRRFGFRVPGEQPPGAWEE